MPSAVPSAVLTPHSVCIGTDKISQFDLTALENRLLEDAKQLCFAFNWEPALECFTHALAVSGKVRRPSRGESSARAMHAAIVHNIGYCLHCLGKVRLRPLVVLAFALPWPPRARGAAPVRALVSAPV